MEPNFRYDLGDKVRDRITGMTGIVISRSEHLFGCERYWVEPQELKDSKPVDGRWFDQDSLELVEAGVIQRTRVRVVDELHEQSAPIALRKTGGPNDQPASVTGPSDR
jgi:hypothetical protein